MHGILLDLRKHIKSNSHKESYKIWKTFDLHERVDVQLSRARREEINRHNEEVRQNREMLKTIIEAALYLSKQELAFRGNDESNTSLNFINLSTLSPFLSNLRMILNCSLVESSMVSSDWMLIKVQSINDRFYAVNQIILNFWGNTCKNTQVGSFIFGQLYVKAGFKNRVKLGKAFQKFSIVASIQTCI